MANMLGLFMMPIVQDQNVLLTYAIACTLVQARNFNLLLLLLLLRVFLFCLNNVFFSLLCQYHFIQSIVIVYVRHSATFHIICHEHLSRPKVFVA